MKLTKLGVDYEVQQLNSQFVKLVSDDQSIVGRLVNETIEFLHTKEISGLKVKGFAIDTKMAKEIKVLQSKMEEMQELEDKKARNYYELQNELKFNSLPKSYLKIRR